MCIKISGGRTRRKKTEGVEREHVTTIAVPAKILIKKICKMFLNHTAAYALATG